MSIPIIPPDVNNQPASGSHSTEINQPNPNSTGHLVANNQVAIVQRSNFLFSLVDPELGTRLYFGLAAQYGPPTYYAHLFLITSFFVSEQQLSETTWYCVSCNRTYDTAGWRRPFFRHPCTRANRMSVLFNMAPLNVLQVYPLVGYLDVLRAFKAGNDAGNAGQSMLWNLLSMHFMHFWMRTGSVLPQLQAIICQVVDEELLHPNVPEGLRSYIAQQADHFRQ